MRFFGRFQRSEPNRDAPTPPTDRIAFIPADSGEPNRVGILSDSQTGDIHRVFEHDGQPQIDAVPIVRRLLHQEIAARNVGCLRARGDHGDCFFGAHFVLDMHFRRAYRVWISPACCCVEQLWGPGLDEVRQRPFAPFLFSWCDLHDEAARHAQITIERAIPTFANAGLKFVTRHLEAKSDVARRLFLSSQAIVRHHARPAPNGTEVAVEIQISGEPRRVVLALEDRRAALKVLGETGEVPF